MGEGFVNPNTMERVEGDDSDNAKTNSVKIHSFIYGS